MRAERVQRWLFPTTPRSGAEGVAAVVAAVAVCTAVIYPLKQVAPVLSLGVVYMLGVLIVSAGWGVWFGVATAVGSALAFNFFHIPPVGTFSIRDSENWVALAAFVVAAVLASYAAEVIRARAADAVKRREEADLLAELAGLLLRSPRLQDGLASGAHRLSEVLGLSSAAVELRSVESDERRLAFPLREGPRRLGTLLVPASAPEELLRRLQERIVPGLETVLGAALERDRLQQEVLETEALRRSDEVKTAILRAASHDLRSPLTAIAAATEALDSDARTGAERAELVAVLGEETQRLGRLIDNLLDLSRLQAGAAEPHRRACAPEELLEAALDDLRAPAGAVRLALDPDLPLVAVDPAQVQRALANVLENALRHADGHPVSVRARTVGDRLMVQVIDRGPGIPPAQLERVFEAFFSGRGRDGAGGSGLGLAIARGFVQGNGGRIWAESLPGQGTTIVIELPVLREGGVP
jgi:two-component system sensor histidine kinase KdpD